jgi:polyisoprenoid-binding protein YceI
MRLMLATTAAALLAACSPNQNASLITDTPSGAPTALAPAVAAAPSVEGVPAGAYRTDPMHSNVSFKVTHMGFSNYTANFEKFEAQLQIDPRNPEQARLTARIDPRSLHLNAPPAGFLDELMGEMFFDAGHHPEMTFTSTKIDRNGPASATISGDFTLRGVTRPVTFQATFNGGYPGMQMDPQARMGFSARGVLKRSDFGMTVGIPQPGSNMGVGDDVEFMIETEMMGPPLANAAGAGQTADASPTPQPTQNN